MKIFLAATLSLWSSWPTMATGFVPMLAPTKTRPYRLNVASVDPDLDSLTAEEDAEPQGSLNRIATGTIQGGNQAMRIQMETMLREAQISITEAIEKIDGSGLKFQEDSWVRDTGGGGHSRVFAGGNVWEKAGVNLSVVQGTMPVEALKAATERGVDRGQGEQVPFFATGLSCVMHPRNPHCPTMHFNYRYFETDNGEHWWFGTYSGWCTSRAALTRILYLSQVSLLFSLFLNPPSIQAAVLTLLQYMSMKTI